MTTSFGQRLAAASARGVAHFLHAFDPEDRELPHDEFLRPHTAGKRFSFSHVNVVIPDLPQPHRHLACLALIGRTGTKVFDIDDVIEGTPRTTATLAAGTAATGPDGFRSYNTTDDCLLAEDGSHIQLGDDLIITGEFPDYHIVVERPGLRIELDARCSDQITRFLRSPVYDHVGYPAEYTGTLTWQGEVEEIEGVLSLEYARATSLSGLVDRTVPQRLKLPWTFFTYHVIKISDDSLLMLVDAAMFGDAKLGTGGYLKQVRGESRRYVADEVEYSVLGYRDEPQIGPDGATTRIPAEFRWTIRAEDGSLSTDLRCTTDTDFTYGLGRGWIGGYSYRGIFDGKPVSGTAYMEYARV